MVDIGELRYDRTVSEEFAKHFVAGGFADSLVDYARGKYPIDFQYRKDPKTNKEWATLYVGLTAVLNVYNKGAKGIALTAHSTYKTRKLGWSDDWGQAAPAADWVDKWNLVERYLERVVPDVVTNGRYVKTEGVVQAVVTGHMGDASRVILDREVCPYFRDTPTKAAVQQRYSAPLAEAIAKLSPAPGVPRTPFGMECDAFAIDAAGHLVAIEIKPGNVSSLAWVAAQATMYARVLQHWVDEDPTWEATVEKSFRQRRALGLLSPSFRLPDLQPKVVPAVAFQRVASAKYIQQMYDVQGALIQEGVGDPAIEFYAVAPSGRLDRHNLG